MTCPECEGTIPEGSRRCKWCRADLTKQKKGRDERCTWKTGQRRCYMRAVIYEFHGKTGLCEFHHGTRNSPQDSQDRKMFDEYWKSLDMYTFHPYWDIGQDVVWRRCQGYPDKAKPTPEDQRPPKYHPDLAARVKKLPRKSKAALGEAMKRLAQKMGG